jgi:hypothetical protein|tara:strand:+ start:293 stop:895 length:603 start_codon:yes stop_codon:yes gene_type:complete
MSNTKLWDSVEKTDPRFTKKVNQRGGFTAIGAQYQVRKATETFGPFGVGWGVKAESFKRYEDTGLVLYQGTLWYKYGEDNGEVPIHSSIKYHANSRVDDDFAKKVATDAMTKGLSKLGFNADVFMGLFDDNKYVSALKKEFTIVKPVDSKWREKVEAEAEALPDEHKATVLDALSANRINSVNWEASIKRMQELKIAASE